MLPVYPAVAQVKFLTKPAGLYLHIPFCKKKCRYCDFYSSFVTEKLLDSYTEALIKAIKEWGGRFRRPINTIYFGGGTPSLLSHRLSTVLNAVYQTFDIEENCEITLELNPCGDVENILNHAKKAGINRLSIGMQSGINDELKILGRTHTVNDTVSAVKIARDMGFNNISLDIMLGLPFSSNDTLLESLELLKELNPEHISAYMLKIEENTAFWREKEKLSLPNDDETAEQYLLMCSFLEQNGYNHYEISNFCKENMTSRHNIKYWNGEDYLGIGPAAHSFVDGRRFYYPRDLKAFLKGNSPLPDGEGGSSEEYIMLRLRLKEGISISDYKSQFNRDLPENFLNKCHQFEKAGFIQTTNDRISLTNNGMLLSNTIITELLECIE